MSKKPKKARKPNVPMYTGPVPLTPAGSGGGGDVSASASPASRSPVQRSEGIQADYTHTITDLKRIGLLAGVLIAILVGLSFFIK